MIWPEVQLIDLSQLNWGVDGRLKKPDYYTCSPDVGKNRVNYFLTGWQSYLNDPDAETAILSEQSKITWPNLGRLLASVLGNISVERRRAIYGILLHQYAYSPRTSEWTDEERSMALSYFIGSDG
jgi:hypothetical protein